jgi:hypothetical protein
MFLETTNFKLLSLLSLVLLVNPITRWFRLTTSTAPTVVEPLSPVCLPFQKSLYNTVVFTMFPNYLMYVVCIDLSLLYCRAALSHPTFRHQKIWVNAEETICLSVASSAVVRPSSFIPNKQE